MPRRYGRCCKKMIKKVVYSDMHSVSGNQSLYLPLMENTSIHLGRETESKLIFRARALRAKAITLGGLFLVLATLNAVAIDTYNYKGVCPSPNGGKRILDKWYEWECECTSYVADKLNERGVPFHARYKNVLWKGAGTWINAATAGGVPYNKTPPRGDVAWYAYGHVAYVDAVDSYGDVTISEYNWGVPHDYHTRTINRGAKSYPNYFIHF
jgi:surface antigen